MKHKIDVNQNLLDKLILESLGLHGVLFWTELHSLYLTL